MESVKSFSGGLVALAFLVIGYQYIISPAAGSFMSAFHARDAAFAGAKAADLKNREMTFKTLCLNTGRKLPATDDWFPENRLVFRLCWQAMNCPPTKHRNGRR